MIGDFAEFLFEKVLGPICIIIATLMLVFAFLVLPIAIMSGWEPPEQRMYRHCIEDGNTDYYCYHMTHTRSSKYD